MNRLRKLFKDRVIKLEIETVLNSENAWDAVCIPISWFATRTATLTHPPHHTGRTRAAGAVHRTRSAEHAVNATPCAAFTWYQLNLTNKTQIKFEFNSKTSTIWTRNPIVSTMNMNLWTCWNVTSRTLRTKKTRPGLLRVDAWTGPYVDDRIPVQKTFDRR